MTVENADSKPRKNVGTLPQQQQDTKDLEHLRRETLKDIVREQVLHALGQPGGVLRVQVRPLWDGKYRVNIFVGDHVASARVASSYFVVTDADGNIVEANPKIEKRR